MTATSGAPQEVKFTSIVNSPVRLAAFDESDEDNVSLKMLGGLEMLPRKQAWNGAPVSVRHKIRKDERRDTTENNRRTCCGAHEYGAECPSEAHVKCTVM